MRIADCIGFVVTVIGVVGLTGCEAQTTVLTTIELPSSIPASARAREQLHVLVTLASSFSQKLDVAGGRCPPFDAGTSAAARAFDGPIKAVARGFELTQRDIPTVPEFCAAAWFDTNHSGKIDAGDAVGQLAAPYPAQPSKFIGSNRYESPPVILESVR